MDGKKEKIRLATREKVSLLVFCRLKMAIIPAEVGVCSWNSTARRPPTDPAAHILKLRRKLICFIFISVLPKIIVRIFILAYTAARVNNQDKC